VSQQGEEGVTSWNDVSAKEMNGLRLSILERLETFTHNLTFDDDCETLRRAFSCKSDDLGNLIIPQAVENLQRSLKIPPTHLGTPTRPDDNVRLESGQSDCWGISSGVAFW
jgi:hypothetical protein